MSGTHEPVNNEFYDELAERWYSAQDDPVALLRAESRLRNPWLLERIAAHYPERRCAVLDVACGAGFSANALAAAGHRVSGVDLSRGSLAVARRHGAARYLPMDAHRLAFADASFEVVCCMDFLEHTEAPARVVGELARVLRPGGLCFFHTFSRNPLSALVVIKGVEWFVRNTPERMHLYRLFIKPRELRALLAAEGLQLLEWHGVRPRLGAPFWKLLASARVPDDFAFAFTRGKLLGYSGLARKS